MVKKWAIHTVLINRNGKVPIPYKEAEEHAFHIIHKKRKGYLEGEHYRFTNIKAIFFSKFKTKKINKNNVPIDIVFGYLKPEYEHLEGGSIFSLVKKIGHKAKEAVKSVAKKVHKVFEIRKEYNNKCQKMIKEYGEQKIVGIRIIRTPIANALNKVLQVISLGKWEKEKDKQNIDTLFHLGIICDLENKKSLLIEKNATINIDTSLGQKSTSEIVNVDLKGKDIDLNTLLENGFKQAGGIDNWFLYSAFTNNCQIFIMNILKGNGLNKDEYEKFIFQDLSKLIQSQPSHVNKVAQGITDMGASVDKLLGNGKKKHLLSHLNEDEFHKVIKKYKLKITGHKKLSKDDLIRRMIMKKHQEKLTGGGFWNKISNWFVKGGGALEHALNLLHESV